MCTSNQRFPWRDLHVTDMRNFLFVLTLLISICSRVLCFKNPNQCEGIKEMKGPIVDAKCNFETVDSAVKDYFVPILKNLTSRAFFRYFRVDLERPCPFWEDYGECSMQGCSVGECSATEIPTAWLEMDFDTPSKSLTSNFGGNNNDNEYNRNENNNNKNGDGDPYHGEFLKKDIIGADITMGDIARSNADEDVLVEYLEEHRSENKIDIDSDLFQKEFSEDDEEEDLNWIDMSEQSYGKVCRSPKTYRNFDHLPNNLESSTNNRNHIHHKSTKTLSSSRISSSSGGVYINLLANPEGYTGYGGPSAHRVWKAIQHENCFLMDEVESSNETNEFEVNINQCTEKRVFYRLMSGLQASISTHVAKDYYYDKGFGEGYWGHNINLFVKAVGSHPNRLTNLYFTFLFVLRAIARAGPALSHHVIHTGDPTDDAITSTLLKNLVESSSLGNRNEKVQVVEADNDDDHDSSHVNQCRAGFDEKVLFLVDDGSFTGFDIASNGNGEIDIDNSSEALYEPEWARAEAQWRMRSEFQSRFRNISRIMDCVTCERCRLWGKLQILGLGTAVKILTVPEKMLISHFLGRQEVIAIVNTLHQLAKSVEFAANINDYTQVVNSQMNIRDHENSINHQKDYNEDNYYNTNENDTDVDDMTFGLKELSTITTIGLLFITIVFYLIFKKGGKNNGKR